MPNVVFGASHGFEISDGAGLRLLVAEAALPALAAAAKSLRATMEAVAGAAVEDNRFSVTVHWRNVAEADVPRVAAAVHAYMAHTGEAAHLVVRSGHCVFELRPDVEWDKGRALEYIVNARGLNAPDTLCIYVGDDVTDEDAFRVMTGGVGEKQPAASSTAVSSETSDDQQPRREDGAAVAIATPHAAPLLARGFPVLVAKQPRRTAAAYSLREPGEVCCFLRAVREAVEQVELS